jgi:hypothetical protein
VLSNGETFRERRNESLHRRVVRRLLRPTRLLLTAVGVVAREAGGAGLPAVGDAVGTVDGPALAPRTPSRLTQVR